MNLRHQPLCTSEIIKILNRRRRQIDEGFLREWEKIDATILKARRIVEDERQLRRIALRFSPNA